MNLTSMSSREAILSSTLPSVATGGAAFVVEGTTVAVILDAASTGGLIAATAANGAICATTSGSGEIIACVGAVAAPLSPVLEGVWSEAGSFYATQGKHLWSVGVGGATVVTGWATSVNQIPYEPCRKR